MSDDTTNSEWTTAPAGSASSGERTGFCQDCGTPLTAATARNVGAAVFCEPCLARRVGAASPGYTSVPPTGIPPQTVAPDEPSPVLAAILGFIPGVGAMYNGQFAKGIVHLVIFAVLVSLSDINAIFGLFVAGWIFYMVFEAYHTAVARRDGLPLPNAFGFNDIGEKMGFGRSTFGATGWRPAAAPQQAAQQAPPQTPPPGASPATGAGAMPATPYSPPAGTTYNPVPTGTAPDWVGYVPPTAFAPGTTVPPPAAADLTAQIRAQAMNDAGYRIPYAETYTGTAGIPYADPLVDAPTSRFPVGALWLIGLGVLILLGNLLPDWRLTERWWPPVLFAGLSLWTLTRRLRTGTRAVCVLRWPVVLMIVAILLALHAAYFTITFGLAVSVLLICFGILLLLERTIGATPAPAPYAQSAYAAAYAPSSSDNRARTSWAETTSAQTAASAEAEDPAATSAGGSPVAGSSSSKDSR
jgi:TM2 domain-containing membrane protein YozV